MATVDRKAGLKAAKQEALTSKIEEAKQRARDAIAGRRIGSTSTSSSSDKSGGKGLLIAAAIGLALLGGL